MIFYHVSRNLDLDGQIIYPRVPLNRMNCEDRETKRICVSPSINGCLSAVGGFVIGEILDVYICESDKFIQPIHKQVPDAPLTGEIWITEPVEFKRFML